MAFQFDRWLRYTKAKIGDALSSGNRELDRLEAEREAERADKPWLSRDGEDLSFDQVKARIEAQEAEAKKRAESMHSGGETTGGTEVPDAPDRPRAATPSRGNEPATPVDEVEPAPDSPAKPPASAGGPKPPAERGAGGSAGPEPAKPGGATGPRSPEEVSADAETEMARLELEERDRASKARLEAIRKELGVEPPSGDGPAGTG